MSARIGRAQLTALAALALVAGAACPLVPEPYTVRLATPQEMLPAPRFKITQHQKPKPQFYQLSVTEREGATPEQTTYVWDAMFPGGYHEAEELTYGVTPPSWTSRIDPKPLERGKKYTFRVAGDGDGYCRFRVDDTGRVHQDD